jgi:hypothetical protein
MAPGTVVGALAAAAAGWSMRARGRAKAEAPDADRVELVVAQLSATSMEVTWRGHAEAVGHTVVLRSVGRSRGTVRTQTNRAVLDIPPTGRSGTRRYDVRLTSEDAAGRTVAVGATAIRVSAAAAASDPADDRAEPGTAPVTVTSADGQARFAFAIGTFNMCAPPGNFRHGEATPWPTRVEWVVDEVAASGVDVLLAQEAGGVPADAQYEAAFPAYVTDPGNSYGGLAGVYGSFQPLRDRMQARGFDASAGGSDGRWIFWKRDVWSSVGRDGRELATGYWCLDFGAARCRVVTYQLLRHRPSGVAVLFVDPHLEFEQSPHGDGVRGKQIGAAIERSQDLADAYGAEHPDEPAVRVIIAGDLNLSNRLGDQDPRGKELRRHGFTDAVHAAVNVTNKTFTTTKKWRGTIDHWTPKETEHRVDQIWVPAGVHVTEWTHRLQSPTRSVSDHDMLVARLVCPYSRPS